MTGRLAVAIGYLAGDDCRLIAIRLLQQAASAGGQVIGDVRAAECDFVPIQNIQIALLTYLDLAAIT
jgi:hypothetical protein